MKLFKDIQFIWWRDWHFGFIKGNPLKNPAAFHLIYKWSLWLGYLEIRKFMTDNERATVMSIYLNNK